MSNNEILSKYQENIPNITLSQLLTVFNQSTIDLDTIELDYMCGRCFQESYLNNGAKPETKRIINMSVNGSGIIIYLWS